MISQVLHALKTMDLPGHVTLVIVIAVYKVFQKLVIEFDFMATFFLIFSTKNKTRSTFFEVYLVRKIYISS